MGRDDVRWSQLDSLLLQMILMVSGGTKTVRRYQGHPNLGVLLTPAAGNKPPDMGTRWACDNAAFSGFDEMAFRRMLDRISDRNDCEWVTAPDVVADHRATLERWAVWADEICRAGQRPAFVAQDGCQEVPADAVALFIGGSTKWKLGRDAAELVAEANRRGLWTHIGRVNTGSRLKHAHRVGATSVDGSQFSRWSETHIPRALGILWALDRQGVLC